MYGIDSKDAAAAAAASAAQLGVPRSSVSDYVRVNDETAKYRESESVPPTISNHLLHTETKQETR